MAKCIPEKLHQDVSNITLLSEAQCICESFVDLSRIFSCFSSELRQVISSGVTIKEAMQMSEYYSLVILRFTMLFSVFLVHYLDLLVHGAAYLFQKSTARLIHYLILIGNNGR